MNSERSNKKDTLIQNSSLDLFLLWWNQTPDSRLLLDGNHTCKQIARVRWAYQRNTTLKINKPKPILYAQEIDTIGWIVQTIYSQYVAEKKSLLNKLRSSILVDGQFSQDLYPLYIHPCVAIYMTRTCCTSKKNDYRASKTWERR